MSWTRSALGEPGRLESGRPKSLTSSAPETPNRSVMVAFILASRSYDSRVISASRRPTRRAGTMKIGSRTATAG